MKYLVLLYNTCPSVSVYEKWRLMMKNIVFEVYLSQT